MKQGLSAAGIIVAFVVVIAVLGAGCYLGYWWLAKDTTSRRYGVNTGTQQYQSSLISQERDRVSAFKVAVDPGQKQSIADQFCAVFPSINPAPPDLVTASAQLCN